MFQSLVEALDPGPVAVLHVGRVPVELLAPGEEALAKRQRLRRTTAVTRRSRAGRSPFS